MSGFDIQTLEDLEFDLIRSMLASYCLQPTAMGRMATLSPSAHVADMLPALRQTDELMRLKQSGVFFPALDFEELTDDLRLLKVSDSVLDEEGFERIHRASRCVNAILSALQGTAEGFPELHILLSPVWITNEIIDPVEKVFDPRWHVRDDASAELSRIRQALLDVRRQIAKNFSRVMRELSGKGILGDAGEAFVNERKVLAVYSTHKRKVSGIVMGSSKTGNLTYIEPEANILLNSELESLHDDERQEIRRILMQLTHTIRLHLELVGNYHDVLCALDFISAKVRLAEEMNAVLPEIGTETLIDLKQAIHPLLYVQNKKHSRQTFAQSITMDKFSRFLVISGPNAGGKSVTMKTIGLLQLMLQSGLLVPVAPTSRMCFFQHILTDIGDNQSIGNQLSTYSYRLKRMKMFLETANRRSLVLLDEFGTGSDPDLGGALAEVFFEELYNRKSFGVITTHYTNIKLRAAQLHNAVNGCMLFNRQTLEPVYKLSVGEPGSSFTFEVAEINGIGKDLVDRAKAKLKEEKVRMDEILSALQEEKNRLELLSESARQAGELASASITDFENKKQRLEEKLDKQQQVIERNNKFLSHGKRMNAFVELYNARAKNKQLLDDILKYLAMEKAKTEEERKKKSIRKKLEKEKQDKVVETRTRQAIRVGSLVKLLSTRQTGTVLELSGSEAVVAFGVFRTRVSVERLEWIK